MTQAGKLKRLRSLSFRIETSTGDKRARLEADYERVVKSLGRVIWVSSPRLPAMHLGQVAEDYRPGAIDGTLKKPR